MRGRPAAILFDLDGTLLDSAVAICDAVSAAFADLGRDVHAASVHPHLGAPLDELYAHFVGDGDDRARAHFTERYIAHHDAHPAALAEPFPSVKEALFVLRHGHAMKTAVATTKPTPRAHAQLVARGLDDLLHHVQGTDPGMRPKPHPDVIHAACRALAVDPADVWMIGDTARDVDAARAAGARAAVVCWEESHVERARSFGADAILRSMAELVGRLTPA